MSRLIWVLAVLAILPAQIITRIQKSPEDLFVIRDWQTYAGDAQVTGIVESNRMIYFATNGAGILRYDKFENAFRFPLTRSNGLADNAISAVYLSASDTGRVSASEIEIVTRRGSQILPLDQPENFYLDTGTPAFFQRGRMAPRPRAYTTDVSDFFAGRFARGEQNDIIGPNLTRYSIRGAYTDQLKQRWLMVDRFGFFMATNRSAAFQPFPFGPISPSIRRILIAGNDVYLAQQGNARNLPLLTRWRGEREWDYWIPKSTPTLFAESVNDIAQVGGDLWMATPSGLFKMDMGAGVITAMRLPSILNQPIFDLAIRGKQLYLASDRGLFEFDTQTETIRQIKHPVLGTSTLFSVAASDSLLFAVGRFGIFQITTNPDRVIRFDATLSFPALRSSIVRYDDGRFWFNYTDGVFVHDPDSAKTTQIVLSSSDLRLNINHIANYEKHLFIGTNKGLLIHYPKSPEWIWLTRREGLPSNQVNHFVIEGEFMYIATAAGLSKFRWRDVTRFH